MSSANEFHADLVNGFKADLEALEVGEVVRKHITTGQPAALRPIEYYELRRDVARKFDLHPNSVILVGSCRTGFSLKPERRYRPTRGDSDLDLAIVSADRFDDYWDSVFRFGNENRAWMKSPGFDNFTRQLFNGWIDPRGLPSDRRFKQALEWVGYFNALMRSRKFGARRITTRLYRTWERLETYQAIMVRRCRDEIGE